VDLLLTLLSCLVNEFPGRLRRYALRTCSLAAPLLLVAPAVAGVLHGPVHFGGHSYFLLDQSSWADAEREAIALGGHLATISDASENDFIFQTFVGLLNDDSGLWIGLNDTQEEGTFRWVSGEPVGYANWAWDEPNNWLGIEDYVHLLPKRDGRPDGSWNDAPGAGVWPPPQTLTIPIYGIAEVVPEPSTVAGGTVAIVAGLAFRLVQRPRHPPSRRPQAFEKPESSLGRPRRVAPRPPFGTRMFFDVPEET
jgi:hypothetical protein